MTRELIIRKRNLTDMIFGNEYEDLFPDIDCPYNEIVHEDEELIGLVFSHYVAMWEENWEVPDIDEIQDRVSLYYESMYIASCLEDGAEPEVFDFYNEFGADIDEDVRMILNTMKLCYIYDGVIENSAQKLLFEEGYEWI